MQVLRLCMAYISALLTHQPFSGAHGTPFQSHLLLDYIFFHGFDHLKHVQSTNVGVLDDMIALRSDMQQHPDQWACILKQTHLPRSLSWHPDQWACIPKQTHLPWNLSWLTPKHDFIIYLLITSLPESSLCAFLRRSPFKAFEGTNPLIYATHFGSIEHAKALISRGISDVNSTGLDVGSSCQLCPLEVAFYRGHRPLFDMFLSHWMATVPPQLFSVIFDGLCSTSPYIVAKLLQCDEFAEWAAKDRHNKSLLRVFETNQYQMYSTEQDLLSMLRRLVQVGCDLSAPDSLQPVLRIIWNAVSNRYTAVLLYLWSQDVPIPTRALLSQGITLVQELASQGLDVDAIMTNSDLAFQRALGQCKHGFSCWTTDCDLCSIFLRLLAPVPTRNPLPVVS